MPLEQPTEENIVDPIDDMPELEVNEDGSVALQEQPDTIPQVEEEPAEETSTPETPEEVNPIDQVFNDYELKKYGYQDPADALKRMPELLKWSHDLSRQVAELKKQDDGRELPSEDDFYDNPHKVLGDLRNQLKAEFNQELDNMKAEQFISSKPDFYDNFNAMDRQLQKHPELQSLPKHKMLDILYGLAKAEQIPQIVKDAKNKPQPPAPDKTKAEVSAGKPNKTVGEPTLQDWVNMSPREIEKRIGVKDT